MAENACLIGSRLGLPAADLEQLRHAGQLHDIGKMAIPDAILHKPGPLDDAEWAFVRKHPAIGERIIAAAPSLAPAARIVRSSHERFDGTGYPDGHAGEQIPLASRIVAVCDAFDAMIGVRPYRDGIPPKEALAELAKHAGSQFDPTVVSVFHTLVEEGTIAAQTTR